MAKKEQKKPLKKTQTKGAAKAKKVDAKAKKPLPRLKKLRLQLKKQLRRSQQKLSLFLSSPR